MYQHIKVPAGGEKIKVNADHSLSVPDQPIIPYIEGDGTGLDITPVMIKVIDAAVAKAYGGKRKIHWMEVYAGEKSTKVYGPDVWLPEETLQVVREYVVSIKGPLTTPVGGGIRSLNVALRQELDLYLCLRPIQYFKGVPSPVREPEKTNMVIFRENSEDIYAGIEWAAESEGAKKLIDKILSESTEALLAAAEGAQLPLRATVEGPADPAILQVGRFRAMAWDVEWTAQNLARANQDFGKRFGL